MAVQQNPAVGACLQGGRVTLASELTLAEGAKIGRLYKQNFTGRVTTRDNLMHLVSKELETGRKFNPGRRVNPTWSVYKGKS